MILAYRLRSANNAAPEVIHREAWPIYAHACGIRGTRMCAVYRYVPMVLHFSAFHSNSMMAI